MLHHVNTGSFHPVSSKFILVVGSVVGKPLKNHLVDFKKPVISGFLRADWQVERVLGKDN